MNFILKKIIVLYGIILFLGLTILNVISNDRTVGEYPVFIFIGFIMLVALAIVTKSLLIDPINKMQRISEKILRGDFNDHFEVDGRDELSQLAYNLNEMSLEFRRRIQENVSDKNELRAILSSMVEGVIVIGVDQRILILTKPIIDMLELRSPETVGKPFWEIIRNEQINSLIREALQHKKAARKEVAILSPKESYFSMQISPILFQETELTGIVAVFHDITELKRLEKIRTEFVANASHELKTPLTSIKGFVETLMDANLDDKQTVKRFLEIIQNHTRRLENLVNDLLSLSANESDEEPLRLEPVDLPLLVENIVGLYKSKIEKKQQALKIDISKSIPNVLVNQRKIEEALSNLVDNAVKFTPEKGLISIRAYEDIQYVRIDVEDSGIGIPPEHLPRIFERFYRVDKARSREMGGTGLGLAIVKHIVQKHNGKVEVQSESEKGSQFSIYLPKSNSKSLTPA